MNREEVMKKLKETNPKAFIKPGEEFDINHENAIWLTSDDWSEHLMDDKDYLEDAKYTGYSDAVQFHIVRILGLDCWYAEAYDSETLFLYEENNS